MHGLINNGLQSYVEDIFGSARWEETCLRAKLEFMNFEPTLHYKDEATDTVLDALASVVGRSRDELLEDFGTYIVSEHRDSPVRRLLQFGGDTFEEFLQSLEDVYDRAKIALPDLQVPRLWLDSHGGGQFTLHYRFETPGYGAVVLGLLRAMADAYNALVTVQHKPQSENGIDMDLFEISLLHLDWRNSAQQELRAS